ncbi:response regulator [Paenibacillus chartarius]|uniref:histidine kinase n=1 Tax=Paenibacillus chartarius TaxID=747481 RepID=A0ABV6DM35_9BACL
MRWVRNARINRKLLMMIIVPILGLLYFSTSEIADKSKELTVIGKLQTLVAAEIAANDFVHELQKERGLVSGYVTQRTAERLDALLEQRRMTDEELEHLRELVQSNRIAALGEQLANDFEAALSPLDKLTAVRTQIDQNKQNDDEVLQYYLDIVSGFYFVMESANLSGTNKQIGNLLSSYIYLSKEKMAASKERAIVYRMQSNSAVSQTDIEQLYMLENEQKLYQSISLGFASDGGRKLYLDTVKGRDVQEAQRMLAQAKSAKAGEKLGIDGDRWYELSTVKIDLLKQVEDGLAKELLQTMETVQAGAIRALVTVILINVFVFAVSLLVIVAVSRTMVRQIRALQRSTVLILQGETDIRVDDVTKDEIGELTDGFNQMVASFREVIAQADRISMGEYEQTIVPRSDRDQLSIALIRMLEALKESKETNAKQYWLKTELARLVGLSQGVTQMQRLATMLISEIAKLVEAGQGVFYVKEQDGRGKESEDYVLLGSYAFKERKSVSARIRPGEGLVGQCVLEKKPIVLTNVPGDYVPIQSGLGEAKPLQITVVPIMYENEVLGVIELASFNPFTDIQHDLLEQLAQSLGVVLQSVSSRQRTEELLRRSRELTEELQAQQEELRTANEELEEQAQMLRMSEEKMRVQSEELQAINEELEEKTHYLELRRADIEKQNELIERSRQELEEKARELELASKYKSEFLANMSHELRTPLNSLLILAKSLAANEEGNLSAEQIDSAKIIYSGGIDLLTLINDILDLSKVEAGKLDIQLEDVRIDAMLQAMHAQFLPLAKEKGLQFRVRRADGVPEQFRTDGQRAEQILKNLLSNAIKFTSSGSVTLEVELAQDDGGIAFTVTDTGIGIAADKQKAIFEAFQQADGTTSRKYGGTGLGLTISRELAKLLGGEIRMRSEEGEGSRFTFILPYRGAVPGSGTSAKSSPPVEAASMLVAASAEPDAAEAVSPRENMYIPDDRDMIGVPAQGKSILIIEDDPDFAQILMDMSRKKGFRCLAAKDGFSALQLAKQYVPSAVLLDLGLPDMDGIKVLDHLKFHNETRHIPVHIISAKDRSFDSLHRGAIGFLSKPISAEDIDAVFGKIENVLNERIQQVLVVEDDLSSQKAIHELLKHKRIGIQSAYSGEEGLRLLQSQHFDCVILDLRLPDMTGFEMLQKLVGDKDRELPPIIVNTGKELTQDEYKQLNRFTNSIVIKGANSPDRLLDEVSLFLHSVHKSLPPEHKEMIRMVRESDDTLRGRKVLLVDDDLRNTFALSKVLRQHGLEVIMADNGQLALEKLEGEPDIELVIMDIMMPVMDGYEAMERIRAIPRFQSLPIIALTAKAMTGDKEKCIERGANDYMTKPVDTDKLLSLIRVWLFK